MKIARSERVQVRAVDIYPYRLTDDGPEFLLLHRAPVASYGGSWLVAGTRIEENEAAWKAAQRGLRRKTGLVPTYLWTLPSVNHFYSWEEDELHLAPAFAAEVEGEIALNPKEYDASGWVDVGRALSNLTWPEQKRLLRLTNRLLQNGPIPDELVIEN